MNSIRLSKVDLVTNPILKNILRNVSIVNYSIKQRKKNNNQTTKNKQTNKKAKTKTKTNQANNVFLIKKTKKTKQTPKI